MEPGGDFLHRRIPLYSIGIKSCMIEEKGVIDEEIILIRVIKGSFLPL
jgi:hypothetical protein